MARKTGTLSVQVTANTTKFNRGMKKSAKSMQVFRKSLLNTSKLLKAAFGLAAIRGIGRSLKSLNAFAASVQAIGDTAARLGVTTENLSKFQFVAASTGVALEKFNMSLQRFLRRTSEAAAGMGEAKDALKELGLNAQVLNRIDLDKQMRALAVAFEKIPGPDKLRLAFKLFDSEGVAMLNVLQLTEDQLKALTLQAEAFGGVITKEMVEPFTKATAEVVKLDSAYTELKRNIAQTVSFKGFVEGFAGTIARVSASIAGATQGDPSIRHRRDKAQLEARGLLPGGPVPGVQELTQRRSTFQLLRALQRGDVASPTIPKVSSVTDIPGLFLDGAKSFKERMKEIGERFKETMLPVIGGLGRALLGPLAGQFLGGRALRGGVGGLPQAVRAGSAGGLRADILGRQAVFDPLGNQIRGGSGGVGRGQQIQQSILQQLKELVRLERINRSGSGMRQVQVLPVVP